jgi:hypothetical protein
MVHDASRRGISQHPGSTIRFTGNNEVGQLIRWHCRLHAGSLCIILLLTHRVRLALDDTATVPLVCSAAVEKGWGAWLD